MDSISYLLAKLPNILGKTVDEIESPLALDKFATAKHIRLQNYYDMWRRRIRSGVGHSAILSNGWAFATMAGLACFEAYVRADARVSRIYLDRPGEIPLVIEGIRDKLRKQIFCGVIIYGYGNLLRESHFVEEALRARILQPDGIYLLDCSLFYHMFAQSPINPLRQLVKREKVIRCMLLDYCEGDASHNRLSSIRNSLLL